MGIFNFLKETFFDKVKTLFSDENVKLKDKIEHLENILLSSDVGVITTEKIIDTVKKKITNENIDKINDIITSEIRNILISSLQQNTIEQNTIEHYNTTKVIIMIGANGVGKTTTIAKLAYKYKLEGKNVIVGAGDTFRAAAIQQLQILCNKINVPMICSEWKSQPASVVFKTLDFAIKNKSDIVIIDTAGRLQTKTNLMIELEKIYNVALKFIQKEHIDIFLVLDGTNGQNVYSQITEFNKITHITGIIVTKLDSIAKSGFIITIVGEYKIPIKYICTGEKIEDISDFDPDFFIKRIF